MSVPKEGIYSVTEEMVMRRFSEGEIPYRCARIELWKSGEDYPLEVGYIRLPYDLYDVVVKFIDHRHKNEETAL